MSAENKEMPAPPEKPSEKGTGKQVAYMFSFLIGLATGSALVLNGPKVRRSLAKAVLTGGSAAVTAGKHVQRVSARVVEDFQDAFAEAQADAAQKEMERQGVAGLHDELRNLRADLSSLRPQSGPGPVQ
jgi:hypothetical protein